MTHTRTIVEIDGGPDCLMYEVYADETRQHTRGFAYTEEDARLIAAATDMLAALRNAEKWVGKLIADGGHQQSVNPAHAERTLDQIAQAITKAEGKES